MNKIFRFWLSILAISFCIENGNAQSPKNCDENSPFVYADPVFNVLVEEGTIYAKGLSHQSINGNISNAMHLKLDVYLPDNELKNRPAIMLIHGGGFAGGTRKHDKIVNMANYFAARGWVAFSIDYRLKKDEGTVPQEWVDYSVNLDTNTAQRFFSVYPAIRDAKAALRWVVANAGKYNVNTNHITVGGGSAGAGTAITLGLSNQEDYRDEISMSQDPTLGTANTDQQYQVHTILDFWGGKTTLDILDSLYNHQRFDFSDPPIFIAHGTEDPTVPFSKAQQLKDIYKANEMPFVFYPLEGKGHGAWNATINGKRLEALAFDFIVEQQNLTIKESKY